MLLQLSHSQLDIGLGYTQFFKILFVNVPYV